LLVSTWEITRHAISGRRSVVATRLIETVCTRQTIHDSIATAAAAVLALSQTQPAAREDTCEQDDCEQSNAVP
jgi:hypothetical protein